MLWPDDVRMLADLPLDDAGRPVGITVEHYSQTVTTPTLEVSLSRDLTTPSVA